MSLNDDRMTDWVVEKLGIVLNDLARVGDIAKDPETPEWYRRRLRSSLHSAFGNALAVLLHALDRLDDERRMAIKLIVDGLNDPRHEPAAN